MRVPHDALASLSSNNVYASFHPFHKKQEALKEAEVTQAQNKQMEMAFHATGGGVLCQRM